MPCAGQPIEILSYKLAAASPLSIFGVLAILMKAALSADAMCLLAAHYGDYFHFAYE